MKRIVIIIAAFLATILSSTAQELNAGLVLNTQKVQTSSREVFTSLEDNIKQLLNTQKWTHANFNRNERINCMFSLVINEVVSESSFTGEWVITSRRPVFNSTYTTPMMNYRDTKFEFDYIYGQPMIYSEMSITSNLVAVMAFYAYVIIGLDFDSFSLNGGKPYFDKAMAIANSAQTLNTKGWEPFANGNSRYDLALALTEESSKDFHTLWYNYHRLGLDEMEANQARARKRILDTASDLEKLYAARPSSPLLILFGETKLDEMVQVALEATAEEKKELRNILTKIFPTKKSIISRL